MEALPAFNKGSTTGLFSITNGRISRRLHRGIPGISSGNGRLRGSLHNVALIIHYSGYMAFMLPNRWSGCRVPIQYPKKIISPEEDGMGDFLRRCTKDVFGVHGIVPPIDQGSIFAKTIFQAYYLV